MSAPPAGRFAGGGTIGVNWKAGAAIAGFAVQLSTDGGRTFRDISRSDLPAGARSFQLTFPAIAEAVDAIVRVVGKDGKGKPLTKGDSAQFRLQPGKPIIAPR